MRQSNCRRQDCRYPQVSSWRLEWKRRVDPAHWTQMRAALHTATAATGLDAGIPLAALRRQLGLTDDRLVTALVEDLPDRVQVDGKVRPDEVDRVELPGLDVLLKRLADAPFAAPEATELDHLGLGPTFYVLAVYFGAVGVKRTRHAIPSALVGDLVAAIVAVTVCTWMFQ